MLISSCHSPPWIVTKICTLGTSHLCSLFRIYLLYAFHFLALSSQANYLTFLRPSPLICKRSYNFTNLLERL